MKETRMKETRKKLHHRLKVQCQETSPDTGIQCDRFNGHVGHHSVGRLSFPTEEWPRKCENNHLCLFRTDTGMDSGPRKCMSCGGSEVRRI